MLFFVRSFACFRALSKRNAVVMLSLIEKYSLETPYNMTNSLQFDGFNIQNRIKNETMRAQ